MIKIENLSKKYGNKIIFDNVNLNFEEGDLVHISGQEGSGISTFFKMIATLIKPDNGKITIEDGKRLGSAIDRPSFFENETILYNLKILYSLLNKYDINSENKINKLCQKFSLDLYNLEELKNYSISKRKKIAIIQAIMEEQDIILLDDPIEDLNKEETEEFFNLINEYNKNKNKLIIIASNKIISQIPYNKKLIIKDYKIYDEI